MTMLGEGLRAGLGLAVAWLAIWAVVLGSIQPEPAQFLAEVRRPPSHAVDERGMFDLRMCADCPGFLLLDRGLGSPENAIPTSLPVVWSWPALHLASRPAPAFDVREVSAPGFAAVLVLQWLILGVAIRTACKVAGSLKLGWPGRRTRSIWTPPVKRKE